MRVFILTLGTRGDFEQFLALGLELRGRGHDVVLGTSGFYATQVREVGIDCVQVGQGTQDELLAILRSLAEVRDKTERARLYARRWLRPQLAPFVERIDSFAAGVDYFVSNLKLVLQRQGRIVPGAAVTYDPPGSLDDLLQYGTRDHGPSIIDLVALNKELVDPQEAWDRRYQFTGFWRDEQPEHAPPSGLAEFVEAG